MSSGEARARGALGWLAGALAAGAPIEPSGRERRLSAAVVTLATVVCFLVATWGLFGPVLGGHDAAMAAVGIIADNMHRWHIAAPVWTYTEGPPSPSQYYCHHPWGIFWTTWLFRELLGRHDFVCRLPAVLLSTLTVPLLAATARAIWRPYAGAAAALGFVALPITLSFAHFNALEVPVMAHSSLFLWGYVRLSQSPRRRYLIASVAGALLAMNADWPAFVLVSGVLSVELFARALRRRPWHPLLRSWWLATAASAALTLALYLVLFHRAGQLGELWRVYGARSSGNRQPLSEVLASRRYWIELMFSPLAIAMGKLFALVCAARALALRSPLEALPLSVLLMAVVQYVVFKQGADIHVFWPHDFAAYFALAMGGLAAQVASLAARAEEAGRLRPGWSGPGALLLSALALAPVARDGFSIVRYARATGGRFDEKGVRIESDGDKVALLRWLGGRGGDEVIGLHPTFRPGWAHAWALGGRPVSFQAPLPPATGSVAIADARFLPDSLRASLLARHGVTAVGPYWLVRAAHEPPSALSFRESEPGPFARYLVSGTEPERAIAPDPFATWELVAHYADSPPPAPDAPPLTPEHHRVLHNAAVARGDAEAAGRAWLAAAQGCRPLQAKFSSGAHLLCARFDDGVSPRLTLLFEVDAPLAADVELLVDSRVESAPPFSLTMPDPSVRELSPPFALSPARFRPGFLYSHSMVVRKRPGVEVFEATFARRADRARERPVAVLRL